MSAAAVLRAARAAGVKLAIDGNDLLLDAATMPPASVVDALRRHKAEVVAILRSGRDGWSARTGGCSSKNGQQSPSSTADCRAPRPMLGRSLAAL
jgi:hypothetical protein